MTTQTEALKLALEALQDAARHLHPAPKQNSAITAIKEVLAQPAVAEQHKQEPVAYRCRVNGHWSYKSHDVSGLVCEPLYPQRKPLTEQQIVDLCDGTLTTWEQVRIARAIEAAHGIKE